jgi:hypothetical protein
MYKWTDDQGKTHYSDKPPEDVVEEIKPEAGPSAEDIQRARENTDAYLERQRQGDQLRRSVIEQEKTKRHADQAESFRKAERCQFAQKQLKKLKIERPLYRIAGGEDKLYVVFPRGSSTIILEGGDVIFLESPEGERIYVEDAQRPAEVNKYREQAETYCAITEKEKQQYRKSKTKESK